MLPAEKLNHLLEDMWKNYCELNPQALSVYESLTKAGEKVVNDHIAFRTFSHPTTSISVLSQHFLKYGYTPIADYKFKEKKLNARHYEHFDPKMPKVFISELDLNQTSPELQQIINSIIEKIDLKVLHEESFLFGGRLWPASFEIYSKLNTESEYAGWVYAHGFRPNHFTVYINHLNKLSNIYDLNNFLKSKGFRLNTAGGEVKGSPDDLLEQSSTMAHEIPVQFNEGTFLIPGCYYEFAKRYPKQNGKLFQGFVAGSADKIFESTNKLD